MAPHILSLAPELIGGPVGDNLSLDDCKNLRLSCKQLSGFLEKTVLSTISFNIKSTNFSSSISKLQCIGEGGSPAASRAATHLDIGCLSPKDQRSEWPPEKISIAEQTMKEYLLPALMSLKNVRSVIWKVHSMDSEWTQDTVVKALLSFRNLQILCINISYIRIVVPLHRLRHLEEITITDTGFHSVRTDLLAPGGRYHREETYLNIGEMIARTPGLTAISVQRSCYYSHGDQIGTNLHELFWCFASDAPPLRLRRLALKTMFLKVDDITLPHLRHLVSLDLRDILEPHESLTSVDAEMNSIETGDSCLLAEHRNGGSTVAQIWGAVLDLGLRLEEIKVDKITWSLLDYLKTYSGLKKIKIIVNNYVNADDCNHWATAFFGSPLASHADSLEEIKIQALQEGSWCFGDHISTVLSSCTKLKSLGISISEEFAQTIQKNLKKAAVVSLLDLVLRYLPRLQTLRLYPASYNDPDDWSGNRWDDIFFEVAEQLAHRLETYSAPSTSAHLPTAIVKSKPAMVFIPERRTHDSKAGKCGEWRYQNIPTFSQSPKVD